MIFSKDDIDDQLPYTKSDNFLLIKVFICSLFFAISLFLVLSKQESAVGLFLLTAGIIWNMVVPLNSIASLVMSVIVGILYAVICFPLGMTANAFLYLAYYVPMQFAATNIEGDTFIVKNSKFSDKQSLLILFYYVLFFISLYFLSSSSGSTLICIFDALSATLLAVSAFARNYRLGSYYKIRIVALVSSIVVWALFASSSTLYAGTRSVLVMYVMYLVFEICQIVYEKNHYFSISEEIERQEKQKKLDKITEAKKREYKNT